jgi:hypothetical protein
MRRSSLADSAGLCLRASELSPPRSCDSITVGGSHSGRQFRVSPARDDEALRHVDPEHIEGRRLAQAAARNHGLTLAEWRTAVPFTVTLAERR